MKQMNFVSIQEDDDTKIVSLVSEAITNFGGDWEEFTSEAEAEAKFLELVRAGYYATGSYSQEVLARNGIAQL